MSGSGPIDDFSALFRMEHRVLRDLILDLIEASRTGDQPEARRLVGRLADMAGPHFRYEEERMYPARGLLPHVSDCEGLSILVERLPESEVARIPAARRRAWDENHDLLDFGVKNGEGASCRLRLSRAAA